MKTGWDMNLKFANYFDLIYTHKDYLKDCDFIEDVMSRYLESSPNKILDVGCGTGIHAMEMARRGYDICAVDPAGPMIEAAIRKDVDKTVRFSQGDVRDFIGEGFDIVYCLFGVTNYLEDFDLFVEFLKDVGSTLTGEGVFVFDSWNGLAVQKIKPSSKLRIFDNDDIKIFRYVEPSFDPHTRVVELDYHCLVVKDDKILDEFNSVHRLRYYSPTQIEDAITRAGLRILDRCVPQQMGRDITDNDWSVCYIVTPASG